METPAKYHKDGKINWYRCKVDPQLMSELMKTSDWQGLRQVGLQLGLFALTGILSWLAWRQITAQSWPWTLPLTLAALFAHGTFAAFLGGTACHELSHKTPFRTKRLNEAVLKLYAFLGWWDHVWFRPSHIKHHQLTVHNDYDGEVVLPQTLSFKDWKFWLGQFGWNPEYSFCVVRNYWRRAVGRLDNDWYEFVMPESNTALRRQHRNWARLTLFGHALLAALFIASGNWILVFVVCLAGQYCGWLGFLCGVPQHFGLSPNVPDFRLCCRTYTCSWLPAFLYWNMQHHIEHHMFPAVPFYNLPRLRQAIAHDLPPAPHGLRATWRQMLEIRRRQLADPTYFYAPPLPGSTGERAQDDVLEREAALGA